MSGAVVFCKFFYAYEIVFYFRLFFLSWSGSAYFYAFVDLSGVTLFFGAKFIWAFVGIYLIGMGFSTLTKMHPDAKLVQMLNNLRLTSLEMSEVAPVCILSVLVGAILLAGSWLMLRKQRVTF